MDMEIEITDSLGDSCFLDVVISKDESKVWLKIQENDDDERKAEALFTPDQARSLANYLLMLANKAEE